MCTKPIVKIRTDFYRTARSIFNLFQSKFKKKRDKSKNETKNLKENIYFLFDYSVNYNHRLLLLLCLFFKLCSTLFASDLFNCFRRFLSKRKPCPVHSNSLE